MHILLNYCEDMNLQTYDHEIKTENQESALADSRITLSCSTQYKDYKYDEKQDIWTLVSLKAPFNDENETEERRAPVDIVAVIDISGSMFDGKLALIKKTLEFFLTQNILNAIPVNSEDRLSLVSYGTDVYLNFPLRAMNTRNKETALQEIKALQAGSSTNLCGGLMKGLVQIVNRGSGAKNEVASVLLFTDGLANHGITNPDGIVAAMKEPNRYDGPSITSRAGSARNSESCIPSHQQWLQEETELVKETDTTNHESYQYSTIAWHYQNLKEEEELLVYSGKAK